MSTTPDRRPDARPPMCEAVSSRGYFCTLPKHDDSTHVAKSGGAILYAWTETPAEPGARVEQPCPKCKCTGVSQSNYDGDMVDRAHPKRPSCWLCKGTGNVVMGTSKRSSV